MPKWGTCLQCKGRSRPTLTEGFTCSILCISRCSSWAFGGRGGLPLFFGRGNRRLCEYWAGDDFLMVWMDEYYALVLLINGFDTSCLDGCGCMTGVACGV